jgi:hypothetical protein
MGVSAAAGSADRAIVQHSALDPPAQTEKPNGMLPLEQELNRQLKHWPACVTGFSCRKGARLTHEIDLISSISQATIT